MLAKINNLKDEIKAQIADFESRQMVYGVIGGIVVYQFVAYFVLGFVPYAPLKIFTWSFFMLIF